MDLWTMDAEMKDDVVLLADCSVSVSHSVSIMSNICCLGQHQCASVQRFACV